MKKVICAVAAFAMIAGVATVASAKVDLSGDGRFRLQMKDMTGDADYAKWDSRFRIVAKGNTESGVYGLARIQILSSTFDNSGLYSNSGRGDNNIWADQAYVGFKKGAYNVSAGRQPNNFTKWFRYDERSDRFKAVYKANGTVLAYTYDQKRETTTADEDKYVHGITYKQKLSDSMNMGVRAVYVMDDMLADRDGAKGSAYLRMNLGGNKIAVEQAYIQGDILGAGHDDAYGGYASWSASFGSVTPTVMVGYTMDGYKVDDDFGWIMIGAAWGITEYKQVGQGGDTVFVGGSADVALSEQLTLQGNLVYMDVDDLSKGDVYEISGKLSYEVVKGANLSFKLGYLDYSEVDEVVNGVFRLDVGF